MGGRTIVFSKALKRLETDFTKCCHRGGKARSQRAGGRMQAAGGRISPVPPLRLRPGGHGGICARSWRLLPLRRGRGGGCRFRFPLSRKRSHLAMGRRELLFLYPFRGGRRLSLFAALRYSGDCFEGRGAPYV